MYVCRWFVLCENVVHDMTSNNLTMVNALSVLRAPSFPALYSRFAFAAMLEREGNEVGPLQLRFLRETSSGDEVLMAMEDNSQAPARAQLLLNFPTGIRLFEEGYIVFRVEVREGENDWYSVGSQRIQVSLALPPSTQSAEQDSPI